MPGSDKSSLAGTLGAYAAKNTARFHMPGHKGRGLAGFWRQELARWDVTEISGTDNLHSPEGAILEAERAASKSFGSEHTIFLVNGSTAGVVAMMMLAKERGSILVDRECHSSAISGAALADAEIAFIQPRIHKKLGRPGVISAEDLDEALTRTGARSVLITSPNYYGLCADLPALSAVAQKHGAWLMVDAAHGAHFPFSDQLPASPAGYADIWVNSAHKTLNALNQAALLHLGKGVSLPRARQMLAMVETTSPSYLIMASLDWARYCAEAPGVW
ncbi:MAG: aminotransferase class I/II-fold pyridoxal phosphate-dependent enzyme, partial [Clostridia bacterium]|nr:aminotransferase class I/II-fold pyridoxal phosphate-dependent enzyme [Clostridia bacterium]